MPVTALAEEVQVEVGKLRRETVGIMMDMTQTRGVVPGDAIALGGLGRGTLPDEEIGSLDAGRKARITARSPSAWRPSTSNGSW